MTENDTETRKEIMPYRQALLRRLTFFVAVPVTIGLMWEMHHHGIWTNYLYTLLITPFVFAPVFMLLSYATTLQTIRVFGDLARQEMKKDSDEAIKKKVQTEQETRNAEEAEIAEDKKKPFSLHLFNTMLPKYGCWGLILPMFGASLSLSGLPVLSAIVIGCVASVFLYLAIWNFDKFFYRRLLNRMAPGMFIGLLFMLVLKGYFSVADNIAFSSAVLLCIAFSLYFAWPRKMKNKSEPPPSP
ncbi:MAG: hypothetical protein GC185_10195 [Alphaproteobacteria bacterium]|nr:hypothetical protein [Alphaproteobacteria bacterium]